MMNRIDRLFQSGRSGILSVYLTAGYPVLNDTTKVIRELAQNGADMIEIGMPFSDPLADGPLLQVCNQQALNNGMTLNGLFEQLGPIRETVDIPLGKRGTSVWMGSSFQTFRSKNILSTIKSISRSKDSI
jgi:tryptophan synthase alpha chain